MQAVLGTNSVLSKSGQLNVEALAQNLVVGLYFAAHWWPPCRIFTQKLIQIYKSANVESKVIEIVFISFDRDEEVMRGYFEEMPWVAVGFGDKAVKEGLVEKFRITAMPVLLVFSSNGEIVSLEGHNDVFNYSIDVVNQWIHKLNKPSMGSTPPLGQADDDIEVNETISKEPVEKLKCDQGHPLVWHGDVGKYYKDLLGSPGIICNLCKERIKRASWHCRECQFDVCKECRDLMADSKRVASEYLKCWDGHTMIYAEGVKEFYVKRCGNDKYYCRNCNTQQKGNNFHCRRCAFDICNDCQILIDTFAPLSLNVKCDKGHPLYWTPNSCKKYKEKFSRVKYSCDACTRTYIGAGSFQCFDCSYDVCVTCIGKEFQRVGG